MQLGPLQKEWIAALRSGKYEQGKEYLCKGGQYCCLGVACKAVLRLDTDNVLEGITTFKTLNGFSSDSMPEGAWQALGLVDNCGEATRLVLRSKDHALTVLNDRRDYTFDMIADLLEEHPEWYFTESR